MQLGLILKWKFCIFCFASEFEMMQHATSFSTVICGISILPDYFERLSEIFIVSIVMEAKFTSIPTVLARMPALQYLALIDGACLRLQTNHHV